MHTPLYCALHCVLLLLLQGYPHVIGVDEAGRGPLAGPVVAAAVLIPEDVHILGITDSKAIGEAERELVYESLVAQQGVLWTVSVIDHLKIDEINILQATLLAMKCAVRDLIALIKAKKGATAYSAETHMVLVDGNKLPDWTVDMSEKVSSNFLIKGDARCYSIAAASIIAKVSDKAMQPPFAMHAHN